MTYSVAIRTLGTSPVLRDELESLHRQTVLPDKIFIYIAEGYKRPGYTVGIEEYRWVHKGMVRQRALDYEEIDSDFILFLDDDVELAPNTVELLMNAAEVHSADCIAPDTFNNQGMSLKSKIFAVLTNLVFPRAHDKWAFIIHRNGSFSYNNNPQKGFYLSQSFAGPAWLCKKDVFLSMHYEDEIWLDDLGFSYGDDALESYKLYKNGCIIGVYYESGIKNLDAKSSSSIFQKDVKKFYIRSFATFVLWWRMIYNYRNISLFNRFLNICSFGVKSLWLFFINIIASIFLLQFKIPYFYIKGIIDGLIFVHSDKYNQIPSYIVSERK